MLRYLDELRKAILNEDLLQTREITDKILNEKDALDYIEPIFRIMEDNPYLDYGIPGPIVFFMESFYRNGYESFLMESIKRKPTEHTVIMINRILNDPNLRNRNTYLAVLENALLRDDLEETVREEIVDFLDYQKSEDE